MKKTYYFLWIILSLSLCSPIFAQPCTGGATQIGGVVFNDFNENGVLNTNETKQKDIVVNIYDNGGSLVGSDITDANGDWFVTVPIAPSVSVKYRVEFMISTALKAAGMQPAAHGTGNKSDVQFVAAAGCSVNFGVNYVGDYCNTNPDLLVACFVSGDPLAVGSLIANEASIVKIPYYVTGGTVSNPTPVSPVYIAKTVEVGSVWGSAYQRETKKIFSSAFLKRHVGLGSQGLGGVYMTDASSATPVSSAYFDLETLGYNLGQSVIASRTLPASGTTSSADPTAFDAVGKVGLGGMDISEDGSVLYISDLYNKQLFIVNIGNPAKATITGGDITTVPMPTPVCTNGVARPFGVTYYKGKVYVGIVCTGENGGTIANLSSSVYTFDPLSNTFSGTPIFTMPMNYPKGAVHTTNNWLTSWNPWINSFNSLSTNGQIGSNPITTRTGLPQPMFSDIAFTDNGDMVLGFMDRAGHQLGYKQVSTTGTGNYSGYIGGDILRAHYNGAAWVLENNGNVGSLTSAGGVGNGQGPGSGEFYNNDSYSNIHQETFMGGVAMIPGTNAVVGTFIDPLTTWSGGFKWFSNTDGSNQKDYQVYATQGVGTNAAATYGKANGLGAIKTACAAAPIEIGNYVWIDTDKDGVQDPNELPLPNVTVKLYKMAGATTSLIASTVTSATGNYYFKDYNEFGAGFDTLTPNTKYFVVLGEGGQWSAANNQLTISGLNYVLTPQNAAAANDQNDTDAFIYTTSGKPFTNYPVDTLTIPSAGGGYVNHTLDFGFALCPTITNPSVGQLVCAGATPPALTVQTNQNATNSIRFVRFLTDQTATATATATELATIYSTGTSIGTVSPIGGASPYTASFTPSATDFPNATGSNITYFVYAILNPDLGAGCRPVQEIQIIVKPTPIATALPASQSVCNGGMTTPVALTSTVSGTTYLWTNNATSIGLAASGTGNLPAFFTTNTGSTIVMATVTVTPSVNGCVGSDQNFTITVNPTPSVSGPSDQVICANSNTTAVNFSGSTVLGTTYSWTNNTPSIGLAASGTGNIGAFTATNATSTAVVATITVTPSAYGCAGTSRTFTITIKPTPSVSDPLDQSICASTFTNAVIFSGSSVANTSYLWTNNTPSIGLAASGTGNIAAFNALNAAASPVTATITVTPTANSCSGAPQTFTMTVNPITTFSTSKTDPSVCGAADGSLSLTGLLNNTSYDVAYTFNGTPTTTTFMSNGAGTISIGSLMAGSYDNLVVLLNGCSTTPPISITLSDPAAPTVDLVPNRAICPTGTIPTINFTGTGSPSFNWTNDNPSIGLAANGTGNIASFTTANVATQQVAYITVTPNNGGCVGTAISFTITVLKPTVNDPTDLTVCAGSPLAPIVWAGSVGASFDWSNNDIATGLAASGSGNIAGFNAANVAVQTTSTITVTPIVSGCAGNPQIFTLTVNPLPTVSIPANVSVCSGTSSNPITFSGMAGTTFFWTNDKTNIGLAASGVGNISTFTAHSFATSEVANITVTPTLNGCIGVSETFTVTINPIPNVTSPTNFVVCSNSTVTLPPFSGTSGAVFNWVNTNTSIGLVGSGSGDIADFNSATVLAQQTATVTVTPVLSGCSGVPKPFTITVNPKPTFTVTAVDPTTCSGADGAMVLSGLLSFTTYFVSYSINGQATLSPITTNGAGEIRIEHLSAGLYSSIITSLNGCGSVAQTVTLTNPPTPSVTAVATQIVCGGGAVAGIVFNGTAGAAYNWVNNNTDIGLGASGLGDIAGFNAANVATDQFAAIAVTPILNGCIGTTRTFSLVVRANPTVNSLTTLSYCSADAVAAIPFSSTPMGATFNWTNDNTNTGLAGGGTGTIATFTAATVTALTRSTISIVPTLNGCTGSSTTILLDVNPLVSAGIASSSAPICLNGNGLPIIDLNSKLTGVTTQGTWTDISAVPAGSHFTAADAIFDPNALPIGTYRFRYTVLGIVPCPDDVEDVSLTIEQCCKPAICLPVSLVRVN